MDEAMPDFLDTIKPTGPVPEKKTRKKRKAREKPEAAAAPAKEAPKPSPVKHRKPAPKPVQQAAVPPPGVSAIGQLSTGDEPDLRRQTVDSIAATERGLNGIGRGLNEQELKTAAHIKEFLKQARQALASGDADGAYTLAAKAKVLLNELRQ